MPGAKVWLAGLACALAPVTAYADKAMSPQGKAHLDAGLKAYGSGNYEAAVTEIEAAYATDPDPSLLYTWAQAERLANRCSKAIDHYRKYLDSSPTEGQAIATRGNIALCLETLKLESCSADLKIAKETAPKSLVIHDDATPWYKSPTVGLLALGVTGLGLGTGFLIAANGSEDRSHDAPTRAELVDLLDEATTRRRAGIVSLSIGGALIVGAIIYTVSTRAKPAGLAIGATGTGSGLAIGGSF